MEKFASNIRNKLIGTSFGTNSNTTLSSNSNESNGFRRIQMPLVKIGLGSTEADLIYMVKKYLEIVGLVLIVWIIGNNTLLSL